MPDKLIIAPGSDPDQYYATGLSLHSPFLTLVRGSKTYVAAGGFEYPQAKAKFANAVRFEELGKTRKDLIKNFLKRYRVKRPLMPSTTTARTFIAVPGAQLAESLFPQRAVKRKDEIAHIKAVQRATEDAFKAVRATLADANIKKGVAHYRGKPLTSETLKRIAAVALAQHNCACPDMIISSGKQSALPHHEGNGPIKEGVVIADIFPRSNESFYFSDCTRTFVVGEAPKTFDERYKAVLEVHKRVNKQLKHGALNVEKTARDTFTELNMKTDFKKGTGYIHSLGHGVGLEIHEEPRLNGTLKAGNVITLEPGLYYDYGIRVEDIGLVTKSGFENFVTLSKNPYL